MYIIISGRERPGEQSLWPCQACSHVLEVLWKRKCFHHPLSGSWPLSSGKGSVASSAGRAWLQGAPKPGSATHSPSLWTGTYPPAQQNALPCHARLSGSGEDLMEASALLEVLLLTWLDDHGHHHHQDNACIQPRGIEGLGQEEFLDVVERPFSS